MGATVGRIDGVSSADLNFASGTLLVEYDRAADPLDAVVAAVESTGHGIVPLDTRAKTGVAPLPWYERRRAEIATALSGGFLLLGVFLGWLGVSEGVQVLAYALSIIGGGLLVWRRAVVSLRARVLDMNVLMTVAVAGAVALGEWTEAATVFFLFSLGGLLEARSLERTRSSIRDLMDLSPATARVRVSGEVAEILAEEARVGDLAVVRPGERIPLDGVVRKGASAVDESAITGESIPAEKRPGDQVFAGTLNAQGVLEVTVSAPADESMLARIVYMVEEAQAARAPSQQLVDRFSRVYTPVVVALAALIAVVPPVLASVFGLPWAPPAEWIERALVLLVVACPCALVLSTPVSIVSAITRASKDGVLVKGGTHLETAAAVETVAFDKTGTLTSGRPAVADVVAVGRCAEDALGIAGALERQSTHPIAQAVVRAAGDRAHPGEVQDFGDVPGRGVRGTIEGTVYTLGNAEQAEEAGALDRQTAAAVSEQEAAGRTALVLTRGGSGCAVIGVADEVRPEAGSAVEGLRELGIEHLIMLTGDNERVAEAVAAELGLSGFLARLLPNAKTDAVRVLGERYDVVAMVGDGINDAPALAASDLGIAMGAAGSDTALETADVALMSDDLAALPRFFELGRRTRRIIAENVAVSVTIKLVVLVAAILGYASLWLAVFADTGVSLLVILNGMRLLRSRPT